MVGGVFAFGGRGAGGGPRWPLDGTLATRGRLVAASLVLAASLLLTGALHEDGLADTTDALGGGSTPERVLAILKDSRIGSFGAAALVSTMLVRVTALAQLAAAAPGALLLLRPRRGLRPRCF